MHGVRRGRGALGRLDFRLRHGENDLRHRARHTTAAHSGSTLGCETARLCLSCGPCAAKDFGHVTKQWEEAADKRRRTDFLFQAGTRIAIPTAVALAGAYIRHPHHRLSLFQLPSLFAGKARSGSRGLGGRVLRTVGTVVRGGWVASIDRIPCDWEWPQPQRTAGVWISGCAWALGGDVGRVRPSSSGGKCARDSGVSTSCVFEYQVVVSFAGCTGGRTGGRVDFSLSFVRSCPLGETQQGCDSFGISVIGGRHRNGVPPPTEAPRG